MSQHLQITEIFHSIQGESTFAGEPCVFVRLTGCNLRCRWCDTEYSFHGGQRMSIDDILAKVRAFPCRRVEITGGEPLLQPAGVKALAERLLAEDFAVMIETSGERDLTPVPQAVIKIVDVKCPDSGEGGSFRASNLELLQPWDELKFVLASRDDYDFARGFVDAHRGAHAARTILFSPVFGQLEAKDLASWMLADGVPARLGLQIHKFIWDPALHGV